jgi:hypothetical protein
VKSRGQADHREGLIPAPVADSGCGIVLGGSVAALQGPTEPGWMVAVGGQSDEGLRAESAAGSRGLYHEALAILGGLSPSRIHHHSDGATAPAGSVTVTASRNAAARHHGPEGEGGRIGPKDAFSETTSASGNKKSSRMPQTDDLSHLLGRHGL